MLNVEWVKCGDGANWCPLATVNLENVTANGVYVIWHDGNPASVVYVGQGDVASRIIAHRKNPAITLYAQKGTLRVTWASVPAAQRDGVERFLANHYAPLVGDAHPDCVPIPVNLAA